MASIPQPIQLPLPFDGRTCNTCNEFLPLEAFPRAHTKLPAHCLSHRCRACQKARRKQYYTDNKTRLLAQQHAHYQANIEQSRTEAREYARRNRGAARRRLQEWRAANPDRDREIRLRYQQTNAAKIYQRNLAWRAANPEKAAQSRRTYKRNNPDAVVIHAVTRRARLKQTDARLTKKQWQSIKAFWDYRCLCCGKQEPEIKVTLDHIIPVCKGGPTTFENTQPLCQPCQNKKYTKVVDFRNPELLYKGLPSAA